MTASTRTVAGGLDEQDCRLGDLVELVAQRTELAVEERWPQDRLDAELTAWSDRRRTAGR